MNDLSFFWPFIGSALLLLTAVFLWLKERLKRELLVKELLMIEKSIVSIESERESLKESFKSLSLDVMEKNSKMFLEMASNNLKQIQSNFSSDMNSREKSIEAMLNPVRQGLTQIDTVIRGIEKERVGAYEALKTQVDGLMLSQQQLRHETSALSRAMRSPNIRGRWGEVQLKRLVEISGLSPHCDFTEQVTLRTSDGISRPDMVVKLPEGKSLVLDAKAPLSYYLEAFEVSDDSRKNELLHKHAQGLRSHIISLSSKAYWHQFCGESVPEFVVLFLPGDPFFSAALEVDPGLIEWSLEKKVILTTPSTLIALLHAVAYGWRQEKLSQQILELSSVGKELSKRFSDVISHLCKLGMDIEGVVKSYNRMVGSFESRLMPSARRFKELNSEKDALPECKSVDSIPRAPIAVA